MKNSKLEKKAGRKQISKFDRIDVLGKRWRKGIYSEIDLILTLLEKKQ